MNVDNQPAMPRGCAGRSAWGVPVLIGLVTAAIRLRLLDIPLDRDEGEYAYFGQLLLQDIPPYATAYNFKMPGIYGIYAVILAVFGQTPTGIHAGLLVVNAVTSVLVFLVAARPFDGAVGGAASAAFAALSLSQRLFSPTAAHEGQEEGGQREQVDGVAVEEPGCDRDRREVHGGDHHEGEERAPGSGVTGSRASTP